ncbi:MAG: AAA family ATPase, partial [Candidatus Bathyarchaeia archaeon]
MSSKDVTLTLRVKDAFKRDAGRGIARLDTKTMERLNIGAGDLIAIKGKRRTVAKAMPAYTEDKEPNVIRIDGATRGNAGVGIDDKVEVS